MATVALIPYRPPLPALRHNDVQHLGAVILGTLDRLGVRAGRAGVVFDRVRLHRGEFISFTIALSTLSSEDQTLILQAVTRERLHWLTQRPVACLCEPEYLLIVIDLRTRPRTWRTRALHWLRHVARPAKRRRGHGRYEENKA